MSRGSPRLAAAALDGAMHAVFMATGRLRICTEEVAVCSCPCLL